MEEEPIKKSVEENDFEADQNLLGFFQLLLKVDMRINPHLYTKRDEKETNNSKPNA